MDIQAVLAAMNPAVYESFKTAIALRKWPSGQALTPEQLATCMQAVITWEDKHVAPENRVGYVPPKVQACEDESHIHTIEKPLQWQ